MNTSPLSILIVDDDVDTCRNLTDILVDFGYKVDVAHDGNEGWERARRRRYDLAILDFKMPGLNGLELYRRIKSLEAGTSVVIVSAYSTDDAVQRAAEGGDFSFLAKPVELPQLLQLVEGAGRGPLVLIVDDDHDMCASLQELFEHAGYRVSVARTQEEAEHRLSGNDYRVVMIDLKLPWGSGRDVLRDVRRDHPESRVVLITGFRQELDSILQDVLVSGADAVCYKPFDMSQLLETISRLSSERS